MKLDELVTLVGGPVAEAALPAPVTVDEHRLFTSMLRNLQSLAGPIAEATDSAPVVLTQSRSPSLVCRVRLLDDNSAAIVVPLGVLARTRTFARILLHALHEGESEPVISLANSAMDDISEEDWEIAPALVPLFGEIRDETDHWDQLAELDAGLSREGVEDDTLEGITMACVYYLVWHEVAHVLRGHFDLIKKEARIDLQPAPRDETAIRRALEIDADSAASELYLFSTVVQLEQYDREAIDGVFFFAGYGLALLFGLYDVRRKALGLYSETFYPHPLVRLRLFDGFVRAWLNEHRPALLAMWDARQSDGWNLCIQSLRRLDIQVLLGAFGRSDDGTVHRSVPATSLNYTVFDWTFIAEEAERLVDETGSVLGSL